MDVEAVIAEASSDALKVEATEVAEATATPVETNEPEPAEKPAIKPDSELTPEQLAKREANRKSHQNSQLAKMRRELRELREVTAALLAPQPANQPPQPPREDDFSTWDELRAAEKQYYKDVATWELKQESPQSAPQQELPPQFTERVNQLEKQEMEIAKQLPDYERTVYGEYGDFMNNLPPQVAQALIEAETPMLAVYALAKEGSLEALEDLSPYRISMEIGKAEIRGQQYLNQKRTTNAPPPMEAARGTGKAGKSLYEMPMDELLKKFN